MANQPETATYDSGVYQLELTDPVQGGVGGLSNVPLLNLANRTAWLYAQIAVLAAEIAVLAPINSPNFTGVPTVPNVAAGDRSIKAINSNFVQNAISGIATVSVGGSANIVLTAAQYGCGILILSGGVSAPINLIFPTQNGSWIVVNNALGAKITCKTSGGSGVVIANGFAAPVLCDGTNILASDNDYSRVTNLSSTGNALFSYAGTFSDPDPGVTRDAKFGTNGIAVRGGTKTDNLYAGTGVFGNRVTLASGNWVCPAGVFTVKLYMTGGGGGGMYSSNTTAGGNYFFGSGGGAGGTKIAVLAVTPGVSYAAVVGAAGAESGGKGGDTTMFGLTAPGGNGGGWSSPVNSPGGSPGITTGAGENYPGGFGQDGQSGPILVGGMGGASFWGGGGRSGNGGGYAGVAPGSGGGGAYGSGAGGAGAAGTIVIEY
jgi:hypothetical protein